MSFWSNIAEWFSNVGHAILGFMNDLMVSIAANGGEVLIDAAKEAVLAAEKAGGTSDEKRAAAIAAVVATLTKEGIPVVTNAVCGAIEAAVATMKATK